MKTLEVLDKVLKGMKMAEKTKINVRSIFKTFNEFSEEWPEKSVVINEFAVSLKLEDISVNQYIRVLNSAGEYMKRNYDLPNPVDNAEKIKVRKRDRRYFSLEEMMKAIGGCQYGYDRELVLTLIDASCRIGGLSTLTGENVGDGYIKVYEKTGWRKYKLDKRICESLKKLAGEPENYVFTQKDGRTPVNSANLTQRITRICIRAGLTGKKLGAHTFRHSSASLVAKKYLNPFIVQQLLQHDNIQSSMNYVHDVQDELVDKDISPLKIVQEYAVEQTDQKIRFKQLEMGKDTIVSDKENAIEKVESVPVIDQDMFPQVPDDVSIRPMLNTDDLRLLRQAFVVMANDERYHLEMLKARQLMKRMLRKSGVEING